MNREAACVIFGLMCIALGSAIVMPGCGLEMTGTNRNNSASGGNGGMPESAGGMGGMANSSASSTGNGGTGGMGTTGSSVSSSASSTSASSSASSSSSSTGGGTNSGIICGAQVCPGGMNLCCMTTDSLNGPTAQTCLSPMACKALEVHCDGPEDCMKPGEKCCGTYDFSANDYTKVDCGMCTGNNEYPICHLANGDADCPAPTICNAEPILGLGYGYCN